MPELASREHLRALPPVVEAALERSAVRWRPGGGGRDLWAGLVGALLVGLTYAKALAFARRLPLIAVNHIEGHIHASFWSQPTGTAIEHPALALVVSGGHTHLFEVLEGERYRLLGKTRDDAAGEAFDKVAKLLVRLPRRSRHRPSGSYGTPRRSACRSPK